MKKNNVDKAMELLDDGIVKEAAKPRKLSVTAVASAVLAAVLLTVGVGGALSSSPALLLNGIEKQAEQTVAMADTLSDYDTEETVQAEIVGTLETYELMAATLAAETDHTAPVADAVEKYSEELAAIRIRAKETLSRFKEAAASYRENNQGEVEKKLTSEQKKALRNAGRQIRQKINRAGKAKKAVTAREIAQAKRAGDTEALNEIYGKVCTSIETGLENLTAVLDRIDELSSKLENR